MEECRFPPRKSTVSAPVATLPELLEGVKIGKPCLS